MYYTKSQIGKDIEMSGPKTSRYVLTEEQRRILEEQQRIIRETKVEQEKHEKLQKKCAVCLAETESILESLKELCDESGMGVEVLCSLNDRFGKMSKNVIVKSSTETLDLLKRSNRFLEQALQEVHGIRIEAEKVVTQITIDYKKELSKTISSGFELSFSRLGKNRKEKDNPFIIRINEALSKVSDIELSAELENRLKLLQKRADEISSSDFLENFCSMQVYPFVRDCEFYKEHIDEYEDLLHQYVYLAAETETPAKHFVFSEENIERLQEEISKLNQILLAQKEQEYISAAIDEAMLEMGYELIGEKNVVKRSGKKFKKGLYTLEEGTAVNVTFSDSGQISMELGVLDVQDRVPTESEATELEDDMRAFCVDYSELEQILVRRGVRTNRISILPPSSEYAQVINTGDYDLRRPVEIHRKEKKKSTIEKKLRKGE